MRSTRQVSNTREVSPTDVILASAERVWHLVTNGNELAQWSRTKLVEGAAGAVSVGNRLAFRIGVSHIAFDVLDMQAPRQLKLDIVGVNNREHTQITPIDSNSCRTTFNLIVQLPARLAPLVPEDGLWTPVQPWARRLSRALETSRRTPSNHPRDRRKCLIAVYEVGSSELTEELTIPVSN